MVLYTEEIIPIKIRRHSLVGVSTNFIVYEELGIETKSTDQIKKIDIN